MRIFQLAIPQIIVIAAHLLTIYYVGFHKSGEIAFWTAIASVTSILFGMRSDIRLMSDVPSRMGENTLHGILIVLLWLAISGLVFMVLPRNPIVLDAGIVCITAASVALNELLSASMIRHEKVLRYVFIRSAPYVVLCHLVLIGYPHDGRDIWLLSVALGLLLSIVLAANIVWAELPMASKALAAFSGYLKSAIAPTLATALRVGSLNLLIVIIMLDFGATESGVWSNIYRIISAPAFFLFSISQTVVLLNLGEIECQHARFKLSKRRWLQFSLGYLVYVPTVLALAGLFLMAYPDERISMVIVLAALIISIYRVFSQHVEVTLHAVGLSKISVLISAVELIIVLLNRFFFGHDLVCFIGVTAISFLGLLIFVLVAERKLSFA